MAGYITVRETVVVTRDHEQEESFWLVLLQTTAGLVTDHSRPREFIPFLCLLRISWQYSVISWERERELAAVCRHRSANERGEAGPGQTCSLESPGGGHLALWGDRPRVEDGGAGGWGESQSATHHLPPVSWLDINTHSRVSRWRTKT